MELSLESNEAWWNRNPKNFRIFSPDELDSNKLSGVLEATNRFSLPS
jgi:phosphoketolase